MTMLIWNIPTRRPRNFAGASSAMYTGPSTDDPPMPSPPMNRAASNTYQFQANAQPSAEIT